MSGSTTKPFWKRPALTWGAVWIVLAVVIVAGTRFYTPGTEPEATGAKGNQDIITDVAAYAAEEFSASVVPSIEEKAQNLPDLIAKIEADPDAAGKEYGSKAGDSPWSFPVTVEGTIGEASFGEVALTVPGMSQPAVGIQTGPAIKGTAVRDSIGTITFGMFENQTEFARAATELNNQVKATVFSEFDLATMQGSTVKITGAFTYDDPSHILITPVKVEVQ